MALLKDAKIKEVVEDRYGRKVAKVYVGRYYDIIFLLYCQLAQLVIT